MLYNIVINQKALTEITPGITLQEAVLLNYFMNICASKSGKIAEKRLDGFTWIDYNKIIQDLPLLGIETSAGLVDKVKNLEGYGYIKSFTEVGQNGKRKYFDTTEKCDLLVFKIDSQLLSTQSSEKQAPVSDNSATCHSKLRHLPQQVNNNIIDNDIYNIYIQLSLKLKNHMVVNNPKEIVKESQLNNWANDFRLMVEKDGRTVEEIKEVMDWCQNDEFWKFNILSAGKFREKFGRLHSAMTRKPHKKESAIQAERSLEYVSRKKPVTL